MEDIKPMTPNPVGHSGGATISRTNMGSAVQNQNANGTKINKMQKLEKFAPLLLRLGMAFVFIYFGTSQLMHPEQWTTFLPGWASNLPITAVKFVLLNGLIEVIGALLLIFGIWTRLVALLLALHLFGIAATVGGSIGVRDVGLGIATLSLFFSGNGKK